MNRNQKLILTVGLVMAASLLVRPPYFGMDRDSGGRTHAAVGYHWVWAPPSSAEVYARLTQSDPETVSPARLASFEARINVVRLMTKLVGVAMVVALGMALARSRAGRTNTEVKAG